MAAGGMRFGITVEGLKPTLKAFNEYGKDANKELRQAAGGVADELVGVLALAAQTDGPQAALVATSVRRVSDRVPAIAAGGTKRVRPSTRPKRRVAAGDVFFGSEFGGGRSPRTRQFPDWTGTVGRWFFPTIRAATPRLIARYQEVLEELADRWDTGGNE